MSIFKFETSFPFPIVKVTTLIHHTEVSKPTGVSYIILVLINESANKKEKLSNLLIQFGVPEDLHGIFANEIYKLINELEIIECKPYKYNKIHFSEYLVGNFVFTEKGRKVFRDELIPTSKSIESKQELFYDPVHNAFMERIPSEWKVGKIESSILPNKLAEQFAYSDLVKLEEYLNSVKGKGIIVKKEEIITDVSIMTNEYLYTTFPIIILIDSEMHTIEFDLKDNNTQAFFEKNYDTQLISDGFGIKRKFNFTGKKPALIDADVINEGQLLLPEQYNEILSKTASFIVTKSNFMQKQSEHVFNNHGIISRIMPNAETVHVYNQNKAFAYIPARVALINKSNKGSVPMSFLVEYIIGNREKEELSKGFVELFNNYSIDNAKESLYVFKVLNDSKSAKSVFENYLTKDIETNISILREIKDTMDTTFIKDWFNQKAQNLYNQYFDRLPTKTIEHQFAIGDWLLKQLNIQNITIINKIIESNPHEKPMSLFILLESLNYPLTDILSHVNVLHEFLQAIVNNDNINTTGNFSSLVKTLQFGLNQMKDLSDIKNSHQFIIKENIDRVKFQEVYNGFSAKFTELLKYEKYSPQAFEELKEYNKHFKYLNNLYIEEKNAASDPKNIDQRFIISKINKQDHFSAIIYLFAKFEWMLKNQYKLSGTAEIMINELKDIDELKNYIPDLHQFRRVRNSIVHPSNIDIKIESDDLKRWTDIVFKEVSKV